jgi:imidazolonepropionase-like amidohydrolase
MTLRIGSCASLALPALLLWAPVHAQAGVVAIRDVTVVDVTDGSLRTGQTVLVEAKHIVAVGPRAEIEIPGRAEVVEGAGKYLIPGLWDMHTHAAQEATIATFYPLFIANGITGLRDVWGQRTVADAASAKVEAGSFAGPRAVVADALIDGPRRFWPGSVLALTAEDGRRVADSLHAAGEPFLKVYSSLSPEAYFAIAERARALGIPFVGHVPELVTAADASDAGQRSLEHRFGTLSGCSTEGDELSAEFVEGATTVLEGDPDRTLRNLMSERNRRALATPDEARCRALAVRFVANGTWLVPTLIAMRGGAYMRELAAAEDARLPYLPPEVVTYWTPATNPFGAQATPEEWALHQALYQRDLEIVRLMSDAGVLLLAGSDTPGPWAFPGFGLHDELALLVQAGLTPLHALQTATLNPARYFERTDELGTVAAGKLADLVLLDANPLEDITNTRLIHAVVADGRLYRRARLDSLLEAAAAENTRSSIASVIRDVLDSDGIASARSRSIALHDSRPDSLRFGEHELNGLGYWLLQQDRVAEAVAVFQMNVDAYPESPNAWDSLGEGLLVAGRLEDARDAFHRAVRLAEQQKDPRLPDFRRKLQSLTGEVQ